MYADSHVHLTDPRFLATTQNLDTLLSFYKSHNLNYFLEAGVQPEGWAQQIHLRTLYPQNIFIALGLHPYFVIQQNLETCEKALDELSPLLTKACALGETGLDFRTSLFAEQNVEQVKDRQLEIFENQIQTALYQKIPLVLHIVRAHEEALKTLYFWQASEVGGQVHAFNSDWNCAKAYLDLNMQLSIGGAVTYSRNKALHEAVKKIPLESLLLESDAPDQSPQGWTEPLNTPLAVFKVAEVVAELKQLPVAQILEHSTKNFKTLFSCP